MSQDFQIGLALLGVAALVVYVEAGYHSYGYLRMYLKRPKWFIIAVSAGGFFTWAWVQRVKPAHNDNLSGKDDRSWGCDPKSGDYFAPPNGDHS